MIVLISVSLHHFYIHLERVLSGLCIVKTKMNMYVTKEIINPYMVSETYNNSMTMGMSICKIQSTSLK